MEILTYRNVNNAPDTALSVLLEDGADFLRLDEVDLVRVNLSGVFVLLGRVRWQSIARDLGEAVVNFRVRVMEVIDRNNLEATSLLEDVDDMRAWHDQTLVRNVLLSRPTVEYAPI